jgi:hypothetical protein
MHLYNIAQNQFEHYQVSLIQKKVTTRGLLECKRNRENERMRTNGGRCCFFFYYFANTEGKSLLLGALGL